MERSNARVEYSVYKITSEGERVYSLLRDAGFTNAQLEMLAIVIKDFLKDNQFGEIRLIFKKGKAVFICPVPSMPLPIE